MKLAPTFLVGFSLAAPTLAQCLEEVQTLTPLHPTVVSNFGTVALDHHGTTLVVGACSASTDPGSAHVFERSGSTWQYADLLLPSVAASHDQFGCTVDISAAGDRIAVGAWNVPTGIGKGGVLVFAFDGASWYEEDRRANVHASSEFVPARPRSPRARLASLVALR